jgi:hypothetical protein
MKKLRRYILIGFVVTVSPMLLSCSKSNKYEDVKPHPIVKTDRYVYMDPDNDPNTIDKMKNWNWKAEDNTSVTDPKNQVYQKLYLKDADEYPLIRTLPWSDPAGPCKYDLASTRDLIDNDPNDGWELLAKDFGSANRAPAYIPEYAFFVLYNKPRGLIRFFFFYPSWKENYSTGYIKLSVGAFGNGDDKLHSAILSYNNPDYYSLDGYSLDHYGINHARVDSSGKPVVDSSGKQLTVDEGSMSVIAFMPLERDHWNYVDFPATTFDPNISLSENKNSYLRFNVFGRNITTGTINLTGSIDLTQVLGDSSNKRMSFFGLASAAWGAGQTAQSNYKSVDPAMTDLLGFTGPMNADLFESIYSLAEVAAVGAPFISSLVSIFKKPAAPVPLHFTGDIVLDGTIDLHSDYPIGSVDIDMPGCQRDENNNAMYKVVHDHPLGVFALKTVPKLGVNAQGSGSSPLTFKIGPIEPLQLAFNSIEGYTVQKVEASVIWNGTSKNHEITDPITGQPIKVTTNQKLNGYKGTDHLTQVYPSESWFKSYNLFTGGLTQSVPQIDSDYGDTSVLVKVTVLKNGTTDDTVVLLKKCLAVYGTPNCTMNPHQTFFKTPVDMGINVTCGVDNCGEGAGNMVPAFGGFVSSMPSPELIPLYQYSVVYGPTPSDSQRNIRGSYYTTNWNEYKNGFNNPGTYGLTSISYVGINCYIYGSPRAGKVPLFKYSDSSNLAQCSLTTVLVPGRYGYPSIIGYITP